MLTCNPPEFYILSIDGLSWLPIIFDENNTVESHFQDVRSPMRIEVYDSWFLACDALFDKAVLYHEDISKRLDTLQYQIDNTSYKTHNLQKITDIMAEIQAEKARYGYHKRNLLDLVNLYGKKTGDITQEMLEMIAYMPKV